MISVPLCDLSGLCGECFLVHFHHRDRESLHRGTSEKNLFPTDSFSLALIRWTQVLFEAKPRGLGTILAPRRHGKTRAWRRCAESAENKIKQWRSDAEPQFRSLIVVQQVIMSQIL